MIRAWAHCPNCSGDYPKRYDLVVEINAENTHTTQRRECIACESEVQLSIGPPVLSSGEDVSEPVYQKETVREYIDDETVLVGRPRDSWYVYVLECEWMPVTERGYEDWKYAASRSRKRYYVGSTDDLQRRLREHTMAEIDSRNDPDTEFTGSVFTDAFPPKRLHEVSREPTKRMAREAEKSRAQQLSDDPTVFVWQA